MNVRAKFKVTQISQSFYGGTTITMSPVVDGSDENKRFWHATPSGNITMMVTSDVAKLLYLGKEYYVDFTPSQA